MVASVSDPGVYIACVELTAAVDKCREEVINPLTGLEAVVGQMVSR